MATTYTVTGRVAIFGPGMILELTRAQAMARMASVNVVGKGKTGDAGPYRVMSQIQFKQGEEVTVVSGTVAKAELSGLTIKGEKDADNGKAEAEKGASAGAEDAPAPGK